MAEPHESQPTRRRSILRIMLTPWFVLGLLLLVIVWGVLITPIQPMGYSYPRLTTHAAADGGALALYLAAEKLGWRVERQERPMRWGADSDAVYAVLAPPEPLTSSDVSTLLTAVSRGGGLLAVLQRNSPLGDSLGINVDPRSDESRPVALAGPLAAAVPANDTLAFSLDEEPAGPDDFMPEARTVLEFERPQFGITRLLTLPGAIDSSKAETRVPGDTTRSATIAASFQLGDGRIVVVSDPAILRNSELEETYGGVIAIRLLEHATPPGVDRLIFDEYHFGYGQRSTFVEILARALFGTPAGRFTLQVAAAALILLLAFAPRALKPRPKSTIERRSPLEHVGALARAYEQVDATRTVMRRLVRGMRRRHTTLGSTVPDEVYLEGIAQRFPELGADVQMVLNALQQRVTEQELSDAAIALERIEQAVYPSTSLVST